MNIIPLDKSYCCYCGKFLPYTSFDFTKEHLIPKSKGGNNLLIIKKPCCKNCNSWRGNQSLQTFKSSVNYHLFNSIFENNYTKYDYEIMVENIDYWINYIDVNKSKLIKNPNS